jgi:hypothetical protein
MPSPFPGMDPYLEEPSQWVLFVCLHDRFHDLVYHLGLRRKHPPGRIVCSLSSPNCLLSSLITSSILPPYPWHASASSNALASCKSAVSKPSVNQP